MANDKKMLLIAIKGTRTQIVAEGVAPILQIKKTALKKEIQWKGYTWDIRNPDAYKAMPIRKKK